MNVPAKTVGDLNYAEVLQALAQRTRTEVGRLRALSRPFLDSAEQVSSALEVVDEARRMLEEPFRLPLGGLTDIRDSVARAAKGALLEPKELIAVATVMFAAARAREVLDERASQLPRLAAIGRVLPMLGNLAMRLERSFEASGEISDRASTDLREARERARGLHRSIKAKLDRLLHDERFVRNLRESYFTLRNDRYVVPVLAQQRAEVPGIVHNASQSGQTLFVEPESLIGLGNDLAIAQSVVLEEERRVLLELSDQVGRESERLIQGMEAIAELDEAEAAGRLALDIGATVPTLQPATGELRVNLLRHPLLALRGGEVVPNDILLSGDLRALVISGPNAGGKTVTLTAIGLCALMLRAGLPLPVAPGTHFPLFDSVSAAVGDAQDLSEGLSTFSAHLVQLREIGAGIRPGSLVLVDEIAADTDPREGAALAIAVLEDFLSRGAVVLVTTHLEELKALAHLDKRFQNARVGFDSRRMAPTFRLQLGMSGASSAIDVAGRMGLPETITRRARELVTSAGGPLAQALAAAEEDRRRLSDELDRARAATREAEALKNGLEQEKQRLERENRETELRLRESLQAELEKVRSEVRELMTELRKKDSAKDAERVRLQLEKKAEEEERKAREAKAALGRTEAPPAAGPLRVGGTAQHVGLQKKVEILELEGNEALVAAGPLKMRVRKDELVPATADKPKTQFPARSGNKRDESLKRAAEAAPSPLAVPGNSCDIRGMRAEEALREMEQFLDRIFARGEDAAVVVHGHGTGALKQLVREHLDRSPYVRMYRPGAAGEGGDGVTVVALRS